LRANSANVASTRPQVYIPKLQMQNNISNKIRIINQKLKEYATNEFPGMAGRKVLRFIDDNFKNQSWEGIAWKRRKIFDKGRALLIHRGILRRSFRMEAMSAAVKIYTDVKYAKVHNEGFNGSVQIPAHTRRLYGNFKVYSTATRRGKNAKAQTGETTVKAHSRQMRIPRRQFMPTENRQSPTLNNQIKRQITLDVIKIIKA
jgi:phage gpG-like protein